MCYLNIIFLTCALLATSIAQNSSKDAIGFPEMEENPDLRNKENRQPVFIPARCPDNELFYPGDQKDDWICDCRPAHLYHPGTDKCWPAFRQGPCEVGQYLVLPQNSVIPVCEQNPCNTDTLVQLNGNCEKLGSIAPCNHLYPVSSSLGVNSTTLVVSCVTLSLETRFTEVIGVLCPPGSRRSVNGKCVPTLL
ncbi:uncharacterized protein LOC101745936 [Bombyx mori]|uniref:DUF4789 domain-containing protein n=1 Tax=Bombyx mori TaxID=7091 RepID=A0A8R2AJP8_BOMMO|nr:uncharacterized protein LOC101745936 [Bombyx mori]